MRPRDQNVLEREQSIHQYSLLNYKRKKGKSLPFALSWLANYTMLLATVGVPQDAVRVAELGGINLHSTAGAVPKAVYSDPEYTFTLSSYDNLYLNGHSFQTLSAEKDTCDIVTLHGRDYNLCRPFCQLRNFTK